MKKLRAKIIEKGPLTEKEAEVLRYLCEGYFRPEIALKLHRTVSTVSKHIEHIAEKLEAHSATEIVLLAEHCGLVDITPITRPQALQKLLIFMLLFGQLLNPVQGRRPPQSPRPAMRLLRRECAS